jgi:hypothetical protein
VSRRRRGGSPGPARRRPAPTAAVAAKPEAARSRDWAVAAGLFAASLAIRLLFTQATPDAGWAYSATLKGDAPLWLGYARALHAGEPFELGLPLHPPGAGYLVAALWDGRAEGVARLRSAWCAIGALAVVVFWWSARRAFGSRVAAAAAAWAACSTGLIVLSSSVGAEAPYLVLAIASLGLVEPLRERPRHWLLAAWGALNGAACLFRVEHLLAAALVGAWLLWGTLQAGERPHAAFGRRAAALVLGFALPLVPWHLSAWAAIERLNTEPSARAPDAGAIAWEPEARRLEDRLPAFARGTAAAFVAHTVRHRGGDRVRAEDLAILEQAFGYVPRPLARFPFVSNYGPLNFALANHPAAGGGFSRAALEDPPRLEGGPGLYPPALIHGLPPPDLALVYPAHLRLFNEGYAVGAAWIAADPARFLRLSLRKLGIFWSGAALGLTGYNLPAGFSGTRRAVDLLVPDAGLLERLWTVAVALACGAGLALARGRPALFPWLLFLASRLVPAVLFFGYARHGALAIPVVALLLALGLERVLAARCPERQQALTALAAALLLASVAIEAARYARPPRLTIDGTRIEGADPVPHDVHRDERIELR